MYEGGLLKETKCKLRKRKKKKAALVGIQYVVLLSLSQAKADIEQAQKKYHVSACATG